MFFPSIAAETGSHETELDCDAGLVNLSLPVEWLEIDKGPR